MTEERKLTSSSYFVLALNHSCSLFSRSSAASLAPLRGRSVDRHIISSTRSSTFLSQFPFYVCPEKEISTRTRLHHSQHKNPLESIRFFRHPTYLARSRERNFYVRIDSWSCCGCWLRSWIFEVFKTRVVRVQMHAVQVVYAKIESLR